MPSIRLNVYKDIMYYIMYTDVGSGGLYILTESCLSTYACSIIQIRSMLIPNILGFYQRSGNLCGAYQSFMSPHSKGIPPLWTHLEVPPSRIPFVCFEENKLSMQIRDLGGTVRKEVEDFAKTSSKVRRKGRKKRSWGINKMALEESTYTSLRSEFRP